MVTKLLLATRAPKKLSTYGTYINKWLKYCSNKIIMDPYQATYETIMSFLVELFHEHSHN